jgi:uncharacterized protein (UPF0335 family)
MTETTDDRLRLHIEAIETLEGDKKMISDDIKDRYTLAASEGYDKKILRQVIKLRKMRADERQEMEAVLEAYMAALGME